jgi:hypothetical protein
MLLAVGVEVACRTLGYIRLSFCGLGIDVLSGIKLLPMALSCCQDGPRVIVELVDAVCTDENHM